MGSALKIRDDLTPLELRRWARVESYGERRRGPMDRELWRRCPGRCRAACGDGSHASRRGCSLQCKGIGGASRPSKGLSPRRLTADEEAALAAVIIAGPEPERDGVCAWTRADLCRWLEERFADLPPLEHDPGSTADGIFPPEGAPEPPAKGRRSAGASKKGADIEARGWLHKALARAWCAKRAALDLFLAHFADTLDQDAHAVMMCDGAGWHDERALTVPDNVTLALLPPRVPAGATSSWRGGRQTSCWSPWPIRQPASPGHCSDTSVSTDRRTPDQMG